MLFLTRTNGLILEARGDTRAIGDVCELKDGSHSIKAEVVGFRDEILYLMPYGNTEGLYPGMPINFLYNHHINGKFSDHLIGRVLDGFGEPLDKGGSILYDETSLFLKPINPLERHAIDKPIDVGVRAINGLITIGEGQRVGIFAGSGVVDILPSVNEGDSLRLFPFGGSFSD